MFKKLLFIIFIALGIFLRVYQFDTLPAGFFIDEINIGVDAKSLVENGTDQYGRPWPMVFEDATDYKLPGYIYAAAVSYKIFGPTTVSIRFPALVSSILTIFLLGYFVLLLFPTRKYMPWYVMTVLSLSFFEVHFARIAYETTLATFFTLLYLIALFQILKQKKTIFWMIIGLLSLFIANFTYPAPRFILPVFTFLLFFVILCCKFIDIDRKQGLKNLSFLFLGNVISFIIPALFTKADTRPLSYLEGNQKLHGIAYIFDRIRTVFVSWMRTWNLEFLFDKGVLFAYRHGTKENGIFPLIFVVPYIIGIIESIKRFARSNFAYIYLALYTFIAGFPSALTWDTPYATRIVPLILSFVIVIAIGADTFFTWLGKKKIVWQLLTTLVVIGILTYQMALFAHIYFIHFATNGSPEFPLATRELGNFVKTYRQEHPNTQIYFLNDRTCHPWGNDAINLWYFADLPSKDMIPWNLKYRTARYSVPGINPFDAYDYISIPTGTVDGITFFPGYPDSSALPSGSLRVYCGGHLGDINPKIEQILKVYYMFEDVKQDRFYFVTKKI